MKDSSELHRWVAGTKVLLLRRLRWWSQAQLAGAAGIDPSQVSRYETGEEVARPQTLERLAKAANVAPAVLTLMDPVLRTLAVAAEGGVPRSQPIDEMVDLREGLKEELAALLDRAVVVLLLELSFKEETRLEDTRQDHEGRAEILWERLRAYQPQMRRLLVEGAEEYRDWHLCVLVCTESERRAAHDPLEAVELAELALLIAEKVPGPEGWRMRLQGYAWRFLGNARRVANVLNLADAAFSQGWALWTRGEDTSGQLDEAYLLDMEASLRREQRRFPEALHLHDQALRHIQPEKFGVVLLNKAITLEEQGDLEGALGVLNHASEVVDAVREPRLYFALQFNRASNMLKVGKNGEATPMVRAAKETATRLGNDLDRIRTQWLEGNLAAALGLWESAVELLEGVRAYFELHGMRYDFALVGLDLAVAYGEQGRFSEIRAMAGRLLNIFKAQGVSREALAVVRLLTEADQGSITIETIQVLRIELETLGRSSFCE